MSTEFMPPAPPAPTPPSFMVPVPVAYGVGGVAEGAAPRGSYGPVIAMLAVVVVLAAAAVAVGRLCFGRRALGHASGGGHDLEAWVERTCGPCVGAAAPKEEEAGAGISGSGSAGAVVAATEQPPEGTERGGEGIVSGGS